MDSIAKGRHQMPYVANALKKNFNSGLPCSKTIQVFKIGFRHVLLTQMVAVHDALNQAEKYLTSSSLLSISLDACPPIR